MDKTTRQGSPGWARASLPMLGMVAATGLGYWPIYVLPLIIGGVVDQFGLTSAQAGFLGSAELGAIALVSLGGARLAARMPPRITALAGALIAVGAHWASAHATNFELLAGCRILAGLGEGVAFAVGSTAVSKFDRPDRVFGLTFIARGLIGAVLPFLLAVSMERLALGMFGVLALIAGVAAPFVLLLPRSRIETEPAPTAAAEASTARLPATRGTLLALAVGLIALIDTLSWAFLERRGVDIGLDDVTIGAVLGITNFVGMLGAAAPMLVGPGTGRAGIVLLGSAIVLGCAIVPFVSTSHLAYALSTGFYVLALTAVIPFVVGIAATLDDRGTWAAVVNAMLVAPAALGPFASGLIVERYGFVGISWAVGALGAAMLVSFVLVFALGRRAKAPAPPQPA